MPKRIGNTQTSSLAGHSDILDIRSHKKLVAQDVYPDTANDVVRGVRFDGSSYLSQTFSNSNYIFTFSVWIKRSSLGSLQNVISAKNSNTNSSNLSISTSDTLVTDKPGVNFHTLPNTLRDTSSWYHLVINYNGTASSIYINGVGSTGSAVTYGNINTNVLHTIGAGSQSTTANYFNGYIAEINFVDGQALLPTDFAYYDTSTGQWKPKTYAGTYGTNGFYLPMRVGQYTQDETAKAFQYSGNSMVSGFKPQTNMEFGSFKFDGSGDTINTVNNYDDLNLIALPTSGNKSWTLESWIYQTSSSGYQTILAHGTWSGSSSTSAISWQLQIYLGKIKFYWNNGDDWAWQYIYDTPVSINTWYHYALVYDHSVGTYGTLTAYINGAKVNLTNASGNGGTLQNGVLTLNSDGNFSSTITDQLFIASYYSHSSYPNWFSGYITDTRIVRGQALYTQNFTRPSQPLSKTYDHVNQQAITGTVALLLQPDAAGVDESGNNNDWTVTGMNKHDGVPDSPHNTFATANALDKSSDITLSEGNLKVSGTGNNWDHCRSTFSLPNDKIYFEIHIDGATSGTSGYMVGLCNNLFSLTQNVTTGTPVITNFVGRQHTSLYNHSSQDDSYFGATSANDIIRVYYDGTNSASRKIWFSTTSTNPSEITIDSGVTGDLFILLGIYGSSINLTLNTGQDHLFRAATLPTAPSGSPFTDANGIGSFYYQPPTGALALCTQNLPAPAIEDPGKFFKTVIYDGNQTSGISKNIGFQPDLLWGKARTAAYSPILIDSLRPHTDANSYYTLYTDSAYVQADYHDRFYITSNGFECKAALSYVNEDNHKFVMWAWRAGGAPHGATSALGSAMIDGVAQKVDDIHSAAGSSLKPTLISANTTAGFGIVTYSIPSSTPNDNHFTIPHGLNKTPEVVIVKCTVQPGHSGSQQWMVYHHSEPTKAGHLNRDLTFTTTTLSENFKNTVPTSAVFTVGHETNNNSGDTCRDGNSYVAYVYHSVPGFSAFGSYSGNGNADGPFVYTGFKPAFILYKSIDAAEYWHIHDNVRDTYNPISKDLYPNLPNSENNYTDYPMDLLSNGFKLKSLNSAWNHSGHTYIYMAFAEQTTNFTTAR